MIGLSDSAVQRPGKISRQSDKTHIRGFQFATSRIKIYCRKATVMAGRAAGRGRSGVAAVGGSEGVVTSGRGRGRGSSPTLTPRAPTTLADIISEIKEMRCYGDQPLPSSLLHKVSFQVKI